MDYSGPTATARGGRAGGGGGVLSSIHSINIEAARLHKAGVRARQAGRSGKENDSYSFQEVTHGECKRRSKESVSDCVSFLLSSCVRRHSQKSCKC